MAVVAVIHEFEGRHTLIVKKHGTKLLSSERVGKRRRLKVLMQCAMRMLLTLEPSLPRLLTKMMVVQRPTA